MEAWRGFLGLYGALCLRLLAMYSPAEEGAPAILEKGLRTLAENGAARVRGMARQSEREFLSELRALLLDAALAEAPHQTPERPAPDAESLKQLVAGLPLLHEEMLYFKLAGYTEKTLEDMLRISPRVAQQAFTRLEPDYAPALRAQRDRCPWPAEWLRLQHAAREGRTESCPPVYQFLRVQDGQVSWYEKEPLEKHVTGCMHCLERWTALREVAYWRRAAPQLTDLQFDEFLRFAGQDKPQRKSFWQGLRRG